MSFTAAHCLIHAPPPSCQVVLSYSLQTGDRRTRVHTLTLRCSRQLQDTFRHYQAQTLLTFYCKKSKETFEPPSAFLCFSNIMLKGTRCCWVRRCLRELQRRATPG